MRYSGGQLVTVGDRVLVDGMQGVVVCDFDSRTFLDGYADWDMPTKEMLGGGTLSSGIMVKTTEIGLVHYEDGTGSILLVGWQCSSNRCDRRHC